MESIYNHIISNLKLLLATFLYFASFGGVLGYFSTKRSSEKYHSENRGDRFRSEESISEKEETAVEHLRVDPIRIGLGYDLFRMAQSSSSDNLFQTIPVLRKELATEFRVRLPKVRARDNSNLKLSEYSIILKEVELGRGDEIKNN